MKKSDLRRLIREELNNTDFIETMKYRTSLKVFFRTHRVAGAIIYKTGDKYKFQTVEKDKTQKEKSIVQGKGNPELISYINRNMNVTFYKK